MDQTKDDTESTEVTVVQETPLPVPHETLANDYELAKQNIVKAVERLDDLSVDLIQVAKQLLDADHYSAAVAAINSYVQANKSMVDIARKQHDHVTDAGGPTNVTNNNTLVLTTAELLQIMNEADGKDTRKD